MNKPLAQVIKKTCFEMENKIILNKTTLYTDNVQRQKQHTPVKLKPENKKQTDEESEIKRM